MKWSARHAGVAGLIGLALVAGACSAAPPPSTEPTAEAGASAAPPALSVEDAAEAYRDLADEFNERIGELEAELARAETLAEALAVQASFAAAELDFRQGLSEIRFPEEVRDEVERLLEAEDALVDAFQDFTTVTTDEEYAEVDARMRPLLEEALAAANALRSALGLERAPAPTPTS